MSEAPEAAVEETPAEPEQQEYLSEDAFGDLAAQRIQEAWGDQPAEEEEPPADETPADTDAEDDVRRNAAGRAIDEQGRFIAEPGDDDTAPVDEPTGAAADAERDALLARVAAHEAHAAALEQRIEQMQASVTQQLTIPRDELALMVEEDPRRAAHIARNQGDLELMTEAVNAWADEGGRSTVEATAFQNATDRALDHWQAQQAQQQAAPPPAADIAPIAAVVQANPDLPAMQPQMDALVGDYPLLSAAIQSGNPHAQADALKTLYDIAKARHTDAVVGDAQAQTATAEAERAVQARADAQVVSATQTGGPAETATFADEIRSGFREAAMAQGHMRRTT